MAFFCASSAHLPHIFCGVAEGSDSWRLGLRKGEGSCRRGCLEEPCVQEGVDRRNLHVFCRLFPGIQDRQPGCPRPLWAVLKKGWRLSPPPAGRAGKMHREDSLRKNSNRKILQTIFSGKVPVCPGNAFWEKPSQKGSGISRRDPFGDSLSQDSDQAVR